MASRKDQKAALRAEREQREREAAAAEKRKRTIGYIVGGALAAAAVVAIVAVLLSGGGGGGGSSEAGSGDWPKGSVPAPPGQPPELEPAAKAARCEVTDPKNTGSEHVEGAVKYTDNPPTSGNHSAQPAEDGAFLEALPQERILHALEHGRVAIQFKPTVPDSVKGTLKALFDEDQYHMIIFPNEMPAAVAVTAWEHKLTCAQYNDKVPDAIRAFKNQWRDRGPESVP